MLEAEKLAGLGLRAQKPAGKLAVLISPGPLSLNAARIACSAPAESSAVPSSSTKERCIHKAGASAGHSSIAAVDSSDEERYITAPQPS